MTFMSDGASDTEFAGRIVESLAEKIDRLQAAADAQASYVFPRRDDRG